MGGVPALMGAGLCDTDDGRSVVAFGDLKSGVVAAACTISEGGPVYDEVAAADGKINRADSRWTAKLGSRSCRGAYLLRGGRHGARVGPLVRPRSRPLEGPPRPDD